MPVLCLLLHSPAGARQWSLPLALAWETPGDEALGTRAAPRTADIGARALLPQEKRKHVGRKMGFWPRNNTERKDLFLSTARGGLNKETTKDPQTNFATNLDERPQRGKVRKVRIKLFFPGN